MAGKITVLIGSPRANGNSAKIAKAIADECQAMGKEVATFHLDKIEGLRGCRACNACKKRGGELGGLRLAPPAGLLHVRDTACGDHSRVRSGRREEHLDPRDIGARKGYSA